MGRHIFVIEQKVLLIFFFTVLLFFYFFKLAAQVLLKIKVSIERCLVSVVVLMRGCSGMSEYEAGKEKITVYSLQKLDYTTGVYDSVFQFLPISSNFAQPLKRSGPTFHRPQSTT